MGRSAEGVGRRPPFRGLGPAGLGHLPATGPLLGKLGLAARHERGWTFPRQVLEALEAVEDLPLPARCGFWPVPGGVAVEAVARTDDAGLRRTIERGLEDRGVPLHSLRLVRDPRQLRRPLPLRCDLREGAFDDAHRRVEADGPAPPAPEAVVARALGGRSGERSSDASSRPVGAPWT